MGIVSDVVGHCGDLGLQACMCLKTQIARSQDGVETGRQSLLQVAADGRAGRVNQRTIVLEDAFKGLPGQVQPVVLGVTVLQKGDDAQGLQIVIETSKGRHGTVQGPFAGMAKGRVAQIVTQGHGLGEVFIQAQRAGDGPGDLAHFQRVGEAIAKVPALVGQKDLCLVLQAPESGGMDDAVAVALEFGARRAGAGTV
ncbi:hypothetical protein D3C87_1480700 [compost metagenome]